MKEFSIDEIEVTMKVNHYKESNAVKTIFEFNGVINSNVRFGEDRATKLGNLSAKLFSIDWTNVNLLETVDANASDDSMFNLFEAYYAWKEERIEAGDYSEFDPECLFECHTFAIIDRFNIMEPFKHKGVGKNVFQDCMDLLERFGVRYFLLEAIPYELVDELEVKEYDMEFKKEYTNQLNQLVLFYKRNGFKEMNTDTNNFRKSVYMHRFIEDFTGNYDFD